MIKSESTASAVIHGLAFFILILLENFRFVTAIVAQASVLETNSASASGGFHNFDFFSLIFNLIPLEIFRFGAAKYSSFNHVLLLLAE
ncbi:MAG: hypothetical protein ABFD91_13750 [Anaerohalosphaeraceae bacterium]